MHGQVAISGASKNAGTKQMAAALLAPGVTTLRNVPPVRDLEVMVELLRAVGAEVELLPDATVRVDASGELRPEAPYELVGRMRASFNVLGPLVARCGEARVALPGGDSIGSRKVDMHLRGLEAMGARHRSRARLRERTRIAACAARGIVLEFPSVGATENLMCAAVLAKGDTVIENAAREPEVTDLAAFLDRMGAQVVGAGTSTIEIEGVEDLAAADSEIMGDRIEAGTLLMACGIAGGEIELLGARLEHLEIMAMKLCEMGMRVSPTPDGVWAQCTDRLRAVDIATLPYPGFATDFMPLAVALMSIARGERDRHREHLRRPVPVRRRARPHGCRRAHRGPPRGRPRRRAAVGRARERASTCGRARRWCSPAWPPTARRRCYGCEHIDRGLHRPPRARSAPWAPTCSGSQPERHDSRGRCRP